MGVTTAVLVGLPILVPDQQAAGIW